MKKIKPKTECECDKSRFLKIARDLTNPDPESGIMKIRLMPFCSESSVKDLADELEKMWNEGYEKGYCDGWDKSWEHYS